MLNQLRHPGTPDSSLLSTFGETASFPRKLYPGAIRYRRGGPSDLGTFFLLKMASAVMIKHKIICKWYIHILSLEKFTFRVLDGKFQWRKENLLKSSEQLRRGILKQTGQAFDSLLVFVTANARPCGDNNFRTNECVSQT